jgi:hypothetical protein
MFLRKSPDVPVLSADVRAEPPGKRWARAILGVALVALGLGAAAVWWANWPPPAAVAPWAPAEKARRAPGPDVQPPVPREVVRL